MSIKKLISNYHYECSHLPIVLLLLFPLFTNTLRHWASGIYALLALLVLIMFKQYKYDLKSPEKLFLGIIGLHVLSTIVSNSLSGWTYASVSWFTSGELRFIVAIPMYLYLRTIPQVWKYFIISIPFGALIIGLTGVIDFYLRYARNDVGAIYAEGIYGHIFQGNISVLWSVLSYALAEYYKSSRKLKMLCYVGALSAALGALVSVTRNAWLSLILLYILMFILQGGISKTVRVLGLRKVIVGILVLFGLLYAISGVEYVKERFEQIYQEPIEYFTADRTKPLEFTSIGFRLEQWRGVIYAFEDKPIFGHGIGNSGVVQNKYIREGRLNPVIYQMPAEKFGTPSHVHNAYLEYLGDTGLVGFICILFVIGYAPYLAIKNRRRSKCAWKFVTLHGAAFAIASLTEVPFIRNNWTSVFFLTEIVFFIWLMSEIESSHDDDGKRSEQQSFE